MDGVAIGQRAASLPWLTPSAGALLALSQPPADNTWVFSDPAVLVHLLRYSRPFGQGLEIDSSVAISAAVHLEAKTAGSTSWHLEIDAGILALSRSAAKLALSTSFEAAVVAALAPLAYFAVAAIDAESATFARTPTWGLTPHAILRALVRSWAMPKRIAMTLANLDLPHARSVGMGADAQIDRVVRDAVALAQANTIQLNLVPHDIARSATPFAAPVAFIQPLFGIRADADAGTVPLLAPLLRSRAELLRGSTNHRMHRLEQENEQLRAMLGDAETAIPQALQDAKLTAVAELAAGAGHEINNPLAVISGQCQRLLSHEDDEETRATLETVIRQTKRIHDILRGLMAYARPGRPVAQYVAVSDTVSQAVQETNALAAVKAVEIRIQSDTTATVLADPLQLRTCLVNLIRNGIEYAGPDGWVSISTVATDGHASIIVEDNGTGPAPQTAASIFDPFFSGRSAGRGRGLGLPIAWRLATINGGNVSYRPSTNSPSRFVVTLPVAVAPQARLSA